MTDLILHIERLLPEHDCLVVPGLGGFVQNETEAKLIHNKETFYPRGKEISFNSRLTFNDGILVQSYQESLNISFEEASLKVKKAVGTIISMLEEGKFVRFGRIGTMHKTEQGNLQFRPDNRNLFYPESYGLMPFAFPNLEHRIKAPVKTEIKKRREDPFIHIRISKRSFQNFLTGAAASLLVLLIAKPAGEIENLENQNAFLLQEYVMDETILENPVTTTTYSANTVIVNEKSNTETVLISNSDAVIQNNALALATKPKQIQKNDLALATKPKQILEEVRKAKVSEEKIIAASIPKLVQKTYYVIISSFPSKETAEKWLSANKNGIYSNAGIIEGDGRARIYINKMHDKPLAEKWLVKFRSESTIHGDAWLLSVKN